MVPENRVKQGVWWLTSSYAMEWRQGRVQQEAILARTLSGLVALILAGSRLAWCKLWDFKQVISIGD